MGPDWLLTRPGIPRNNNKMTKILNKRKGGCLIIGGLVKKQCLPIYVYFIWQATGKKGASSGNDFSGLNGLPYQIRK
jgi:hypothetical protein